MVGRLPVLRNGKDLLDCNVIILNLTEKYGFNVQIPLHFIIRVTYFYSASDDEEQNKMANELVNFALDRDPESIDDFIEVVGVLNNQGEEGGSKRLTAYVCNKLSQNPFCTEAQN